MFLHSFIGMYDLISDKNIIILIVLRMTVFSKYRHSIQFFYSQK